MNHELAATSYDRVKPLYEPLAFMPFCAGVLEGCHDGRVYVDDVRQPRTAFVLTWGCWGFLGGDPDRADLNAGPIRHYPDSEGYDVARRVLNPSIDKHPALIVQPSGAADVSSAVTFAREHDLLVAVKCGGHSFSGKSTCDGGMQIDLSMMRGARVDRARPTRCRAAPPATRAAVAPSRPQRERGHRGRAGTTQGAPTGTSRCWREAPAPALHPGR